MKRFPFVLLAVSVAAMTACSGKKTSSSGETAATGATGTTAATGATAATAAQVMAPGHINVQVFCPDSTSGGGGVRVLPWKRRVTMPTQGTAELTWNVLQANGMDSIVVAAVDTSHSPFQQSPFSLKSGLTETPLSSNIQSGDTLFFYRLTVACGADSMVIDPEIIIS